MADHLFVLPGPTRPFQASGGSSGSCGSLAEDKCFKAKVKQESWIAYHWNLDVQRVLTAVMCLGKRMFGELPTWNEKSFVFLHLLYLILFEQTRDSITKALVDSRQQKTLAPRLTATELSWVTSFIAYEAQEAHWKQQTKLCRQVNSDLGKLLKSPQEWNCTWKEELMVKQKLSAALDQSYQSYQSFKSFKSWSPSTHLGLEAGQGEGEGERKGEGKQKVKEQKEENQEPEIEIYLGAASLLDPLVPLARTALASSSPSSNPSFDPLVSSPPFRTAERDPMRPVRPLHEFERRERETPETEKRHETLTLGSPSPSPNPSQDGKERGAEQSDREDDCNSSSRSTSSTEDSAELELEVVEVETFQKSSPGSPPSDLDLSSPSRDGEEDELDKEMDQTTLEQETSSQVNGSGSGENFGRFGQACQNRSEDPENPGLKDQEVLPEELDQDQGQGQAQVQGQGQGQGQGSASLKIASAHIAAGISSDTIQESSKIQIPKLQAVAHIPQLQSRAPRSSSPSSHPQAQAFLRSLSPCRREMVRPGQWTTEWTSEGGVLLKPVLEAFDTLNDVTENGEDDESENLVSLETPQSVSDSASASASASAKGAQNTQNTQIAQREQSKSKARSCSPPKKGKKTRAPTRKARKGKETTKRNSEKARIDKLNQGRWWDMRELDAKLRREREKEREKERERAKAKAKGGEGKQEITITKTNAGIKEVTAEELQERRRLRNRDKKKKKKTKNIKNIKNRDPESNKDSTLSVDHLPLLVLPPTSPTASSPFDERETERERKKPGCLSLPSCPCCIEDSREGGKKEERKNVKAKTRAKERTRGKAQEGRSQTEKGDKEVKKAQKAQKAQKEEKVRKGKKMEVIETPGPTLHIEFKFNHEGIFGFVKDTCLKTLQRQLFCRTLNEGLKETGHRPLLNLSNVVKNTHLISRGGNANAASNSSKNLAEKSFLRFYDMAWYWQALLPLFMALLFDSISESGSRFGASLGSETESLGVFLHNISNLQPLPFQERQGPRVSHQAVVEKQGKVRSEEDRIHLEILDYSRSKFREQPKMFWERLMDEFDVTMEKVQNVTKLVSEGVSIILKRVGKNPRAGKFTAMLTLFRQFSDVMNKCVITVREDGAKDPWIFESFSQAWQKDCANLADTLKQSAASSSSSSSGGILSKKVQEDISFWSWVKRQSFLDVLGQTFRKFHAGVLVKYESYKQVLQLVQETVRMGKDFILKMNRKKLHNEKCSYGDCACSICQVLRNFME